MIFGNINKPISLFFFIIMHHQKRKWLEKWVLPFDSLAIFRQRQFKRTLARNDKEMNELSLLDKLHGLYVINLKHFRNKVQKFRNIWQMQNEIMKSSLWEVGLSSLGLIFGGKEIFIPEIRPMRKILYRVSHRYGNTFGFNFAIFKITYFKK